MSTRKPFVKPSLWRRALALTAAGVLFFPIAPARAGVVLTTLFSFAGTNGSSPQGALVQGRDGNLYGITQGGGLTGGGVVYSLGLDGTFTCLASLTNRAWPRAGLILGPDGSFYGTTSDGGAFDQGAIFGVTPTGALSVLVSFNRTNGAQPGAPLTLGADGNIYGTTEGGGVYGDPFGTGYGTIFRVTPEGALTTLVFFNGANGGYPWAGLVQGADGNFYGTTRDGGAYEYCPGCGPGIAFKVTPAGEFSLLASLDGINAVGALAEALVLGQDGNFYGVSDSGTNRDLSGQDLGNVFRLTPGGAVSSLFSFNGTNGTHPLGLMQASDGNFYGLTVLGGVGYQGHFSFGSGTIYQFTPAGAFRSLVSFTNNELPFASLVQASDGNLYGTTRNGGTYGQGTVFRLSVPMKPVMRPIAPTNGSLLVSWRAVAGQTYQLQSTLDLALPEWADLGTPLVATNGTMTILDPITPQGQRFYRVAVLP